MPLGQGLNEIIIAPATPSGTSAVAILRLSGLGCHKLVQKLFVPHKAKKLIPWKLHLGNVIDPESGKLIDQVLLVLMPGPHTYTGEELAEIHCHGNPQIVKTIMAAAISCGARLARPGEFSERAFLQGKMDLLQVEALSQLLSNEVQASQPHFLQEVEGQLGQIIGRFEKQLVNIQATLQASLDYPEDVNTPDAVVIASLLKDLAAMGEELLVQQQAAQRINRGLRVVLLGAPNAGKSTLINALVKNNRLLVSAVAGTTRDFVEVPWVVGGYRLLLVDTAGLGECQDDLDAASQERSKEQLKLADIVLYLQDGTEPLVDELAALVPSETPVVTIASKADKPGFKPITGAITLSAHNRQGMDVLLARVGELVEAMAPKNTAAGVLTSARQASLVQELCAECALAQDVLGEPTWPMLASDELARIEKILAELTGRSISEEVMSEIFSHFCLGK